MAYDALRMRNMIQVFAMLAFHAALIMFASLQAYETSYSLLNYPDRHDGAKCGTAVSTPHPLYVSSIINYGFSHCTLRNCF
jgi:hypothetical protein